MLINEDNSILFIRALDRDLLITKGVDIKGVNGVDDRAKRSIFILAQIRYPHAPPIGINRLPAPFLILFINLNLD